MAKNKISEFSSTPANNTDVGGIDIAEGCAPSGINNAIRTLMSDLKDWQTGSASTSNTDALAVLGGGTGAITADDARTNLGAAKAGANTDITSLSGLTTPITVAQGGTGFVAQRTITSVGRATNVVTIATSVAHGYVTNDIVTVAAVTNTSVNGTFTITGTPTSTTFTYAQTGSNYSNTTDTGTTTSSSYLVADNLSGVVSVSHGGTGASTLKVNNLLVGNGTSSPTLIPAGSAGNVLTSQTLTTVTAGSFVVGTEYTIATVGTTSFTSIGASANTVGVVFTATGVGTGTGTATTNTWASVTPATINQLTRATAQASTSGTSIDFTSIPSWVKRITVMFQGVSLSGSSTELIQIGSSSFTTTGYASSSSRLGSTSISTGSSTSGFLINTANSGIAISGAMTLSNLSENIWVESHTIGDAGGQSYTGGGVLSLSGVLDRVRITTTNGTDTFDAGSINIMYE